MWTTRVKLFVAASSVPIAAAAMALDLDTRQRVAAYAQPVAAQAIDFFVAARKQQLLATVSGKVLELSPGSGSNFRHYPAVPRSQIPMDWTGLEENAHLVPTIKSMAAEHGFPVSTIEVKTAPNGLVAAMQTEIATHTYDVVVSTLTLSQLTTDEQARLLTEVYRVLKPGGRFYFMEHCARGRGEGWLREKLKPDANAPAKPALALKQGATIREFMEEEGKIRAPGDSGGGGGFDLVESTKAWPWLKGASIGAIQSLITPLFYLLGGWNPINLTRKTPASIESIGFASIFIEEWPLYMNRDREPDKQVYTYKPGAPDVSVAELQSRPPLKDPESGRQVTTAVSESSFSYFLLAKRDELKKVQAEKTPPALSSSSSPSAAPKSASISPTQLLDAVHTALAKQWDEHIAAVPMRPRSGLFPFIGGIAVTGDADSLPQQALIAVQQARAKKTPASAKGAAKPSSSFAELSPGTYNPFGFAQKYEAIRAKPGKDDDDEWEEVDDEDDDQ